MNGKTFLGDGLSQCGGFSLWTLVQRPDLRGISMRGVYQRQSLGCFLKSWRWSHRRKINLPSRGKIKLKRRWGAVTLNRLISHVRQYGSVEVEVR